MTVSATPERTTSTTTSTTTAVVEVDPWRDEPVTAADLGASWHEGCPVGPEQLRRLHVRHVGFDGAEHDGALVVRADAVDALRGVFQRLLDAGFPIHQVQPVDAYGADDDASMAADNTSAFNCRPVAGTTRWSEHAYGAAIDVNPFENPSVEARGVVPPGSDGFLDRGDVRPGMAVPGSPVNDAFAAAGWGWGGTWSSPDYQHFSMSGR